MKIKNEKFSFKTIAEIEQKLGIDCFAGAMA